MHDPVIIRRIQPGEANQVRELILAGLEERWGVLDPAMNPDLEDLSESYSQAVLLVAHLHDLIVGSGALIHEGGSTCRIVRMSVDQSMRRQGIGASILGELIQEARRLGYERVVLETTAAWEDAVDFYQKRGFLPLGIENGDMHLEMHLSVAGQKQERIGSS